MGKYSKTRHQRAKGCGADEKQTKRAAWEQAYNTTKSAVSLCPKHDKTLNLVYASTKRWTNTRKKKNKTMSNTQWHEHEHFPRFWHSCSWRKNKIAYTYYTSSQIRHITLFRELVGQMELKIYLDGTGNKCTEMKR